MNCTNCGSALASPAGFCGTCGQPVPASPNYAYASPVTPAPAGPYGPQPPSPYAATAAPPQLYASASPATSGNLFSFAAFVLSALALIVMPILVGAVAIAFGFYAGKRGERFGKLAFRIAPAATAVGVVLWFLMR